MKKIVTLLALIGICNLVNAQWINLDSMITVRCAFMSGAINDTGYAVSGGGSGGYLSQAEMYIRSTNTWQSITDFPDGNHGNSVAGFAIGDTVYCGLGAAGGYSYSNNFWKYDPNSNTWTQINGIPGQGRAGAVSFVINGKGYVGGGLNSGVPNTYLNDNPLNDFFVYDPSTGQWDSIAPCPAKGTGFQCTAFVLNGKAYVGTGGQQVGGSYSQTFDPVSDFWAYDPTTNTWDSVAPFGGGNRMGCFAFATCNFGYVGTGVSDANQSHFRQDVWKFDPTKGTYGTWTQVDSFAGSSRSCAHTFVIGSRGYVCGGSNNYSNSCGSLWEYIPIDTPKFAAPASICAGSQVTFTDTSNYAPTNWVWKFSGGTPDTSTMQNPVITYSSPGTYTVTFTAYSSCDSGTIVDSNYITVGGALAVAVSPTYPQVCSGQSVALVASGGIGASYQWVGTTDTTDTLIVSPSKDTTYELLVSNGVCNKDTFIAVHTGGVLSVNIQPQSLTICAGQTINLKVTGGSTYNWSPTTGLNTTTGDSVIANPSASVTYTVTASDSLGCTGTGVDTITVVPVPNTPTISQHGDTLVSSANTDNQWYLNGTAIAGATGSYLIIGKSTGVYTVAVENPADGCTSNSVPDTTAGINIVSAISNQISVYPNPTSNQFTVSSKQYLITGVEITDVLGRLILVTPKSSGDFTRVIDLSHFAAGVYFVRVMTEQGDGVVKVMKD